jgi:membrane-associated protein
MSNLPVLLAQWRYLAIVVAVLLGNLGLPIPEEAVFLWSGYLAWSGDLSLLIVILAGVTGAVAGDNIGYRLGRRYGRAILGRRGAVFGATPGRMDRFVLRYGAAAIFVARFVPGLRALAGPLAGVANVPFPRFFAANALGALAFVPMVVALGYSLGHSVGLRVEELLADIRHGQLLALGALLVPAYVLFRRVRNRARPPQGSP